MTRPAARGASSDAMTKQDQIVALREEIRQAGGAAGELRTALLWLSALVGGGSLCAMPVCNYGVNRHLAWLFNSERMVFTIGLALLACGAVALPAMAAFRLACCRR